MYTVDYFITKFEAIPEEQYCEGVFRSGNACCANGHCGVEYLIHDESCLTAESIGLQKVFSVLQIHEKGRLIEDGFGGLYSDKAAFINNGLCDEYRQSTPKQRILAALYDIKKIQQEKQMGVVNDILSKVPASEVSETF